MLLLPSSSLCLLVDPNLTLKSPPTVSVKCVCVCVVTESYPDWTAMDAVDEDEHSESSEDNRGQLKSGVRAN